MEGILLKFFHKRCIDGVILESSGIDVDIGKKYTRRKNEIISVDVSNRSMECDTWG